MKSIASRDNPNFKALRLLAKDSREQQRQRRTVLEGVHLVEADVVSEEIRYRHDPLKLAATIMRLYDGRASLGPLTHEPVAEQPLLVPR